MGQTLTNGIYLPNEGERNCYSGLAANWNAVDTLKGNYSLHAINVDIHVTSAEKETWNGKADASALTAHTGNTTIHVTSADKEAWNGKADNSALTAHTGDTTIHVTSEDKEAWNSKADASALTAHTGDTTIHVTAEDKAKWDAVTSKADSSALTAHTGDTTIHVTAEDKQAWNGHVADSVKHVTAEDKAKWDAVTSKADDSAVVHKSGDETVGGKKTFSDDLTIYNSDSSQSTKNLNISSSKIQVGDTSNSDTFGIIFNAGFSYVSRIMAFKDTGGTQNLQFSVRTKDSSNNLITSMVRLRLSASGNGSFEPGANDSISLGSSSFKYKDLYTNKINGVEPSSLSLPNFSSRIDISSYVTNLNGGYNAYTPSVDGWIAIQSNDATFIRIADIGSGGLGNTATSQTAGILTCMMPVRANRQSNIYIKCTTLVSAYFIPCQGNV